ncbi:uncharacterized protein TM35_000034130 [Trypanosoma theileri]|uniref:Uncharacterized protein n=1 Tax=Trypanosoma theileri TaxID=67003 RepID=A0A1X0P8A7_9TRYP|nr:uncharacterized protein TM35_000034130 [Trypanosoma theileri]ORC92660.1 hypothetical protein TM35_000034130 [Trypanosoma theileri]
MSFASFNSFTDALRRVYPCRPRLLMYNGCLTVHPNRSNDIVEESDTVATATAKAITSTHFIPLVTKQCYYCKEEKKDLLLNFTQKYGYNLTLFLMDRSSHYAYSDSRSNRKSNLNNKSDRDNDVDDNKDDVDVDTLDLSFKKEMANEVINSKTSAFTEVGTPRVNLKLIRCESRVNLTNCTRTRMLQDELRRTENERWLLYQSNGKSSFLSVNKQSHERDLSSLLYKSPDALHLLWNHHEWYFEDPLLVELQAKQTPHPSNSTGYWQAWLKPFNHPFKGSAILPLQDVQQLQVTEDVKVINVEAKDRYLAEGHEVIFSWKNFYKVVAPHYWATTGELIHSTEEDLHYTSNTENEKEDDVKLFSVRDKCWFTQAELPQRQLQVRRGGNIFQMPIYYDGCGFFLHAAPHWFLLPREEVLRRCPITFQTVKNIPFLSESGNTDDVIAAANNDGPLRNKLIFVLKETKEWYTYPRKYGLLNFNLNLSQTSETYSNHSIDSSSTTTEALIFIEFSIAVGLMQDWCKTYQNDLMKANEMSKQSHQQSLVEFFATLPSVLSTTSFINAFIARCASPVKLTSFTTPITTVAEETTPPTTTTTTIIESCSENTVHPPCTGKHETIDKKTGNKSPTSSLKFDETDDSTVDFPAVDRRVYTPGHRLSKAYTHPREEQHQTLYPAECKHLTPAVAAEIIEQKKKKNHHTFTTNSSETSSSISEEEEKVENTIKDNIVLDLGITWLSFRYNITAVNALDTEVRT